MFSYIIYIITATNVDLFYCKLNAKVVAYLINTVEISFIHLYC
jgi:hypothetical protein